MLEAHETGYLAGCEKIPCHVCACVHACTYRSFPSLHPHPKKKQRVLGIMAGKGLMNTVSFWSNGCGDILPILRDVNLDHAQLPCFFAVMFATWFILFCSSLIFPRRIWFRQRAECRGSRHDEPGCWTGRRSRSDVRWHVGFKSPLYFGCTGCL